MHRTIGHCAQHRHRLADICKKDRKRQLQKKKEKKKNENKVKHTISWSRALRIHVTGIDTARVADGVDGRERSSTLRRRAWQRVRDPAERHHIARVHARDHQHHRQIARRRAGRRGCDDERRDGDVEAGW